MTAFFLVLSLLIGRPAIGEVSSAAVRILQQNLLSKGFDPGPVDGIIGPRTEGALRRFQEANGLPVSGRPDDATRTALVPQPAESGKTAAEKIPAPASGNKTVLQSTGSATQAGQIETSSNSKRSPDRIGGQPMPETISGPVREGPAANPTAAMEQESSLNPPHLPTAQQAAADSLSSSVQAMAEAVRPQTAAPLQPPVPDGKFKTLWSSYLRIFLLIALGLCALGLSGWLVLTVIGVFLASFVAEATGWRWPLSFHVGFTVVYALPLLLGIAWKNFGGIFLFLLLLGAPSFILSKYGLDSNWILAASDGFAVMNLVPVSIRRMVGQNALGMKRSNRPIFKNKK